MAERKRGVTEEMENFPQRILNAMTYTLDFFSVGSKESVKGFKSSMSPGRIEYGCSSPWKEVPEWGATCG